MPTIAEASLWYPANDPTHGFAHIRRVYALCERLGQEEGTDLKILRAAALLHDAESGFDVREEHHLASARFARQILYAKGWPDDQISAVQHCIRAHRFRDNTETPKTLEAKILFDADKLDVIGAVGGARTIAFDVVVNQPIFAEPSPRFLETGEKEPGEPHSSYHEYLFKLSKIKDRLYTSTAQALANERHQFMAEYFYRLAAEERGEK